MQTDTGLVEPDFYCNPLIFSSQRREPADEVCFFSKEMCFVMTFCKHLCELMGRIIFELPEMINLKRHDSDELGLTGLWGRVGHSLNECPQVDTNSLHGMKGQIRDPGSDLGGLHTGGCDCHQAHLSGSHGRKRTKL